MDDMSLMSKILGTAVRSAEKHEAEAAGKAAGTLERVEAHAAMSAGRTQYEKCVANTRDDAQKAATINAAPVSKTTQGTLPSPSAVADCKALLAQPDVRSGQAARDSKSGWETLGSAALVLVLLFLAFRWFQRRA
jgi:hypothetical protein